MIPAFHRRFGQMSRVAVSVLLVLASYSSGCGSSGNDLSSGVQGSATAKSEAELYRYEGTGKARQKTRIRREQERFKELTSGNAPAK